MKFFISAIILIFSLHSLSKADDISDFQIEGISLWESATDFFNKEEIEKRK